MKKLVMLLDIYEEEVVGVHSVGEQITEKDEAWIISKQFGFIKWLVENEKIDMKKHFYDKMSCVGYSDLNIVLCELAIQDNPIEFLVSILK